VILIRLAVVGLVALVLHGASQQTPDPTTPPSEPRNSRGALAVLRRDGLLLPFAAFNGDIWQSFWPVDLRAREIPVTLDAVPKNWWGTQSPRDWQAWFIKEANPQAAAGLRLELQAPAMFPMYCRGRLGIRTTYKSSLPLPPAPVEPFPKDALAVSGDVPLNPIETVDRASADWVPMAVALLAEVNQAEDIAVKGIQLYDQWRHPFSVGDRHKLPVVLESWYRSPGVGRDETVSYVEVVRKYPPGPDDEGCGLETFVSGWIVQRAGQMVRPVQLRAKVAYCDRVGVTYMLPFGRIRSKARDHWVFQLSGWEGEWYAVAQVAPGRVRFVLEVPGGSRRGCASM
jgi:hypothetical protein